MSALVIPELAPQKTRRIVTEDLMAVPRLTRLLDTPGLLVAVCLEARRTRQQKRRLRWLREAARTAHRELVRKLQLPGLAVLRSLTGDALEPFAMRALSRLAGDRFAMRILRHARYVSSPLIISLDSQVIRRQIASGFCAEIGSTRRKWRPRTKAIAELAGFLCEYRPSVKLQSLDQFRRLRGGYRELIGSHRYGRRERPELPAPPWPGEPGYAIPLTSWEDLIAESVEMHNCVGEDLAIWRNVQKGRSYIYRVEAAWGMPRATMYVEKSKDYWRIKEVSGHRNEVLTNRNLHCLSLWVAECQGRTDERSCLPVYYRTTR